MFGVFFLVPCPLRRGGYEGVHHTPSVIWFRAYSSTNLCMAFVSTEIRTPALVVRSQSSVDGATPQLACYWIKALRKYVTFVTFVTIVAKTEIQTIETISGVLIRGD